MEWLAHLPLEGGGVVSTAAPVLDKNIVGFLENWKIIPVFAQEK